MTSQPATPTATGQLSGQVCRPSELSAAQRRRMADLLHEFFENVTAAQFEHDLGEKEWVVLLCDSGSGEIQGFSTLMRLQLTVDDRPVTAFYSGDTIIHPSYWQEAELPRVWGRHVFAQAEAVTEDEGGGEVYWFLISSGYKTYRFLPVFFREFYPSYAQPTPSHIRRVIEALAAVKFPGQYDTARGIIRFDAASPLRAGVAEVTDERLKDPHVAFFVQANPGHAQGEQLACLVRLTRDNLTPAGRRMLASRAEAEESHAKSQRRQEEKKK